MQLFTELFFCEFAGSADHFSSVCSTVFLNLLRGIFSNFFIRTCISRDTYFCHQVSCRNAFELRKEICEFPACEFHIAEVAAKQIFFIFLYEVFIGSHIAVDFSHELLSDHSDLFDNFLEQTFSLFNEVTQSACFVYEQVLTGLLVVFHLGQADCSHQSIVIAFIFIYMHQSALKTKLVWAFLNCFHVNGVSADGRFIHIENHVLYPPLYFSTAFRQTQQTHVYQRLCCQQIHQLERKSRCEYSNSGHMSVYPDHRKRQHLLQLLKRCRFC